MNKIKSFLILGILCVSGVFCGCAKADLAWYNDLRTKFINNDAYIYTVNLRTFGAVDYNNNDIIELELGETKGTFINAIPKLENLKRIGINTVYLLPITKVGKLKALGNAGSLYAMDSFDTINPQLFDETDFEKDIKNQARKFIDEAHKLKMAVIIDLPSCGSYDLSLERPELFFKDKQGKTIIPADWTDVRMFKVRNDDGSLNSNLIDEYKKFVDLVQNIGADGIRADVAAIKPKEFWAEIINYARKNDNEFLFLAEASPNWENPAKGYTEYATVEELLTAGFDGFYSNWDNLYEVKTGSEFIKRIQDDLAIIEKFNGQKSMIANFATHDQVSPLKYGPAYWEMVNWLNMSLPVNPYILDGFPVGETYVYKFKNKKAEKSYTDYDSYFVHQGKMDIFNFSRSTNNLKAETLIPDYEQSTMFRYRLQPLVTTKNIIPLKVDNTSVFAFMKKAGESAFIVVGNLDNKIGVKATVKIPKLKLDDFVFPVKITEPPITNKGKIDFSLKPNEVQVMVIKKTKEEKKR